MQNTRLHLPAHSLKPGKHNEFIGQTIVSFLLHASLHIENDEVTKVTKILARQNKNVNMM